MYRINMYHSKQNRFRWIAVAVAVMALTQGVGNAAQQTTDADTQAQADVRKAQKKEKKQERIDAKVRRRDGDDTQPSGPAGSTANVKAKADFQKHAAGASSSVSAHAKPQVPTVTGKSGTTGHVTTTVQSQQATTAVTQPSVAAKVVPATQIVPATVTTTTTAVGATKPAPLTTNVLTQQPSVAPQTQAGPLNVMTGIAPAATPQPTP
jgi:hypothetical protein